MPGLSFLPASLRNERILTIIIVFTVRTFFETLKPYTTKNKTYALHTRPLLDESDGMYIKYRETTVCKRAW